MDKVDILIIGAGVIGLAVAKEAAQGKRSVVILERNRSFGQETSSRNSEVIHGGMYYPSASLKARFCVEGRRLLYEACEAHGIPCRKTGKLIVATEKKEIRQLDKIFELGKDNGVEGLKRISAPEISSLEPNVTGIEGIYSAETGIVDSHRLMQCLLELARERGALIVYDSEVTAVNKTGCGYNVSVRNAGEEIELSARAVVNCAGLDSDAVAGMTGIDVQGCGYALHYCKGAYFRVTNGKSKLISRLVYPVPQPEGAGLGVHATLDLAGGLRLGPDEEYLSGRDKDYSVDEARGADFYEAVRNFMPFINRRDLYADTAGIRPKLQEPGGKFMDFVIRDEEDKGLPGFINLVGIESPGLTASLAIARYVGGILGRMAN